MSRWSTDRPDPKVHEKGDHGMDPLEEYTVGAIGWCDSEVSNKEDHRRAAEAAGLRVPLVQLADRGDVGDLKLHFIFE